MNETSVSLLGRVRDGGNASWNRLASVYTPLLRSWMKKYGVQDADADDLVQEVLMTVARELPSFEHSGRTGAFRRWLKTILIHRLQNFWRSQKRKPAAGRSSVLEQLEQLEDDRSQASHLWDAELDRHVIARLLNQVRPRFQDRTCEAFCRLMFDGQRAKSVAVDLDMSLKAVHLAKSRVLFALRSEASGLIDSFAR